MPNVKLFEKDEEEDEDKPSLKEPYEYKISPLVLDAQFGSEDCLDLVNSLIETENEAILTTPIMMEYIDYLWTTAMKFILGLGLVHLIFTLLLTCQIIYNV
jgi:hypothetical protein